MHLAVYTDAPTYGGAEESLGNLIAELPSEYRVSILGTDRAVLDAIARRRAGSAVVLLRPVPSKRHVRPLLSHIRTVRRLRPDVLHANLWTPWSCQYGILAGLVAPGVSTVAVEQLPLDTRSASQRWLKGRVSRRLSAHVAVGERAARLIEAIAGLEPNSVQTVFNGVPEHRNGPHGAPRDRPVVGTLGRLHEQKGYDVLLHALAQIPEADAVLVGDGPMRPELEALAARLGISERVEFAGWRDDARAALPSFDVFALPSRYEGFPLSIVEAMLAGIPVVATDVGSVPEAILPGRTGLLVEADDPVGLEAALRELLDDEERRRSLADAARERAREHFTAAAMARRYIEIYEEITGGRDDVRAGSPGPQS